MSTTSSELLRIMSLRLSMIRSGMTRPLPVVAAATELLVERLSALAADEEILVVCTKDPLFAQYIRSSTGEMLAEIRLSNEA